MTTTSARRRRKRPTEPEDLTDDAIAALAAANAERAMLDLAAWAERTAPAGHYFDEVEAERKAAFFPRYLRHTRGRWAGQPFRLLPWQKIAVRLAFGWKREDHTRRFRIVYTRVPRKNGKTGLAAGVGLILAAADHEPGAEVYSFATDTDQAALAHDEAKRMRAQSDALRKRSLVYKKAIVFGATSSAYKVLSSTAGTKHGLNASGLIGDEIHALASRDLYDVLHTSTGSRTQPLEWLITTAGYDRHSFCGQLDDYAVKVLAGIIEDPEFLPVLFGAEKDDDYTDPRVWAKANPSLGATLAVDYVRKEAAKAKALPSSENAFKRLQLNVWTEQHTRAIPMDKWDACAGPVDAVALEGRECFAGLDLSSKSDLTALSLLFPPVAEKEPWKALVWLWCPEEKIAERAKKDRKPYQLWCDQGLIEATAGNVVDYDVIRTRISGVEVFKNLKELPPTVEVLADAEPGYRPIAARYRIREIAFDRWNSSQLVTQLMGDGHEMVEFGQGYASMAAPTKELIEVLIGGKRLAHGGNKVLRWMASNVSVKTDPAGNMKPDKDKSGDKIDGIVALIMALGRAIPATGDGGWTVDEKYECTA